LQVGWPRAGQRARYATFCWDETATAGAVLVAVHGFLRPLADRLSLRA